MAGCSFRVFEPSSSDSIALSVNCSCISALNRECLRSILNLRRQLSFKRIALVGANQISSQKIISLLYLTERLVLHCL